MAPRWPLELESSEKRSSARGGILNALRRHSVAALALFLVLGGSAYAGVTTLDPESVGSREIANHSVESEDLARGAVTTMKIERNAVTPSRIAPNAVNSDDVEDGSLTLQDIRAGQVPEGRAGERGSQGPTGQYGQKGDLGEKGDAGEDGDPGEDGDDGDPGAAGTVDGLPGAPGPTGPQGPQGAPGAAGQNATNLWAVLNPDGSLIRGSHVVSTGKVDFGGSTTGSYEVIFDRNLTGCVYVATLGGANTVISEGQITTHPRNNNVNGVFIFTYDSAAVRVDRLFQVAVLC